MEQNRVCIIVASLPEEDLYIPHDCLLIAADQGWAHLHRRGYSPYVAVGDFDSLESVPASGVEFHRYPVQKDDTDMLLAVREGLRLGAKAFILYGGLGGRLDHTLANLQTLAFLRDHGAQGVLFGGGTAITMLSDAAWRFSQRCTGTVSVFCFGDHAFGVTETGLQYSLDNADLTNAFPVGISNEFTGQESTIRVREGSLLLLWQSTAKDAFETLMHNISL